MNASIRMPLPRRFTVEEYLVIERKAKTKSEFHQGTILAMAGGLPDHNKIALNISGILWAGLRGSTWTAYSSDQPVAVAQGESVYYPDITVICGELELYGRHRDIAANPKLVVEVLSKSTGRYDRVVKLPLYQRTPSMTDVLLVAQDRIRVEHVSRDGETVKWKSTVYSDRADVIEIASIGCSLALSDVYSNVR